MSDKNALVIDVPGAIGGGQVTFTQTHVHFKSKSIAYQDVEKISFHALHQSVNLIPVSQSYNFMIASDRTKISFSIGTSLHVGRKSKQEAWARVVTVAMQVLAPVIVKKLIGRIFNQYQPVKIGGVTFSRDGYSKTTLFGGAKTVSWGEKIYTPTMERGAVTLFQEKGGRGRPFATIKASEPNAVLIPDLVQACYTRVHAPHAGAFGSDGTPFGSSG
jgi:hypothetical protein